MATAVRMPRWGMIMEAGSILNWIRKEGEAVEKGEVIAEIESEKVANELEAPASGVLARILVAEEDTADVGALLAIISDESDDASAIEALVEKKADATARVEDPPGETIQTSDRRSDGRSDGKRRISPAAKRIAANEGLNWQNIRGSGPGGRIQVRDIKAAIDASVRQDFNSLSSMRQAIARRTTRSIEAPQAALYREIDLTELLAARADGGSLTALLIRNIVLALEEARILSSRFENGTLTTGGSINIGVVVGVEGGIAVPVIHGAESKTLGEIDHALKDLVSRASDGSLKSKDLEGGTFTVSNAGGLGIDLFQALLNPPEVAALGIGQIKRRAVVVGEGEEERIEARSTAYFSLSTDHRIADAEPAGLFLQKLDALCMEKSGESK